MVYLYEFEERNKRRFNKLLTILLVISSALLGLIIYLNYNQLPVERLSVTEIICETSVAREYPLGTRASSFDSLRVAIESRNGYGAGSVIYKSMSNTEHCGNGAGLWFENPVERKRFVYCLDAPDGKVVEFDINSCRKLGGLESAQRGVGELLDAFEKS